MQLPRQGVPALVATPAAAKALGLSDPDRYSGITYDRLPASQYTLFSTSTSSPRIEDVVHNQAGVCWLLSATEACLRDGGTQAIKIRQVDSSFTIFEVELVLKDRPAIVRVDNRVPFKGGVPWPNDATVDNGWSGKLIAWPLPYVKAYLQLADKYKGFTPDEGRGWLRLEGGHANLPIGDSQHMRKSPSDFNKLHNNFADEMRLQLRKRQATVFASMPAKEIKEDNKYNSKLRSLKVSGYVVQLLQGGNRFASVRNLKTGKTLVLVLNHAYACYAHIENGEYRIYLANPWGVNHLLVGDKIETRSSRYVQAISLAEAMIIGDTLYYG